MRTTLTIDDDVMRAARALAAAEGISLGHAVSIMARAALPPRPSPLGIRPLPRRGEIVTTAHVRRLRDGGD